MLILTACKKDDSNQSILEDIGKNLKILRVQYNNESGEQKYIYLYDENNRVTKVVNEKNLDTDNEPRFQVQYRLGELEVISQFEGTSDNYWNRSIISLNSNKIESIEVHTPLPGTYPIDFSGRININRTVNGQIKSVELDSTFVGGLIINDTNTLSNKLMTYYPISTQIVSFNENNHPYKSISTKEIQTVGTSHKNYVYEFDFQYDKAANIPAKLKRLINEELLHLNKFGVTNFDVKTIATGEQPWSEYGEGNWLVSFGLPQYHILEDKSTHMVSKRTTKHYKINDGGEKEYIKTTIEDFPYVHDADAKTLEINGLKIWYEYVD